MKQTITESEFKNTMQRVRPDQFSWEALGALFDYYTEYEQSAGEELDFDPIAICCDWTEYESLKEFQEAYSDEYKTLDDIDEASFVIRVGNDDGPFLVHNF